MTLTNYYKNGQFARELHQLKFDKGNSFIRQNPESFRLDNTTIFWGGSEWQNISKDMAVSQYPAFFALGLFAITCNDQHTFHAYPNQYAQFRKLTNYPKFGWCGFGPHMEDPRCIIQRAADAGYLTLDENLISELVQLWIDTAIDFFQTQPELNINTNEFFRSMLNYPSFDRHTITQLIKNKMLEMLNS